MRVASTIMQNSFGKYLELAIQDQEVIITRNGKDVVKLVPCGKGSFVAESGAAYIPTEKPGVSYEEFLKLVKDSDIRYELIDGEVFVMESPVYQHQVARDEIFGHFYNWFKGKSCRPVTSPFDVTLFKTSLNINVVQPDILVMCDKENVDEKGKYKGVPVLLVEVLSASNRRHDMLRKLDLYLNTGIREYWIADPQRKEVHVHCFESSEIADYYVYVKNDVVRSKVFEGLEIPLEEIFPDM